MRSCRCIPHGPTAINTGHMDEVHFVSTIPYNENMVETNLTCSNQCPQVTGNETMEFQIHVELRLD